MTRFLAMLLAAVPLCAQSPHKMELTLERLENSHWQAVDPGLVFNSGDRVRFRFRASFDGYLYVMNSGTSGSYELLFPREETGRENNLKAGREYVIPATAAYFRVSGPAGHDVLYFLVNPGPLGPSYSPLPPPPASRPAPQNLTPRCDEAMFRARGACIDSSAGPRQLRAEEDLPSNLEGVAGAAARELTIVRRENQSLVSSPAPLQGPVIYEFRLAHKGS